jgi:hypothetical protein
VLAGQAASALSWARRPEQLVTVCGEPHTHLASWAPRSALAPPTTALDGAVLGGGGIVAGIAIEGH